MPDIFACVWVKVSQNYLYKKTNLVNADVYLKRLCKRTGTCIVNNHDGSTTINGQWGQILLLHKLLTNRHRKKMNRCNISERLLQKYRLKRQKMMASLKEQEKTLISEGTSVDDLNGSGESDSVSDHVITKSKESALFQEELTNNAPEITKLDFQKVVKDSKLSKRKHFELESKFENQENEDAEYFPNQSGITKNEEIQPKKKFNVFKCSKCDFTSIHKSSVRDHELRIHLAVPEKCHLCKKVFPSCQHLKRHMISHQHPRCMCDVCGKIYKNSRTLDKHKKIHGINYQAPNFECLHCKKSFSSKAVLENHVETQHAGKKSAFLCATCGKVFTRKYSLQQHQLIHIGSRLNCDVCHKSFSCESSLRDHKKIHSDLKLYKCPVCSKSFKQRTSLQKHSKIHTGDKSFKCSECGRGFTQKQALQRHERSHKGLKPFTCKICHKSYGDRAIIRKHLILVHKINKDPLNWKEDIEQNEYDSSFDISYDPVDQRNVEMNDTQMAAYNTYESGDMIPTENVSAIQLPITTEHNAKSLPVTLPEDLSMSTSDIHHIQSQMHQLPMSMYQHSQSLYNDHVDPSGVDHSVYPTQHGLSSVATYPYMSSSQTQQDQSLDNNHTSSNPYLHVTTAQSQSADNMEDNPTTSHPYLSSQPHPPSHVEEDHNSSSHQYNDSMLELTSTQQPEDLTPKRTPDADSAENLSLSTLYAYYSSLASQYLNLSGYSGYHQQSEDQPQS